MMTELRADAVQALADRLFSLGVSGITTVGPREQADLVAASRALRALLRHFELASGRQISSVILCGRGP